MGGCCPRPGPILQSLVFQGRAGSQRIWDLNDPQLLTLRWKNTQDDLVEALKRGGGGLGEAGQGQGGSGESEKQQVLLIGDHISSLLGRGTLVAAVTSQVRSLKGRVLGLAGFLLKTGWPSPFGLSG